MKKLIYALISKWFLSGCSDYNSLDVRRSCRTKEQGKKAFNALNVPNAKSTLFYSPLTAFSFVKEHSFPVVVKPNIGGFSRGAHFPIENNWQLLFACITVKIWWPRSIIEQYLSGNNYRIVTIKDGVMSIIQRYPPFVIGNGVSTISTLIDKENKIRTTMNLLPVMSHIPKNWAIKAYLHSQKLNLSSILEKDQQIFLHNKISLKLGSVVQIIDREQLTENNLKLLQSILYHFDANILGIDVICEQDLSVDFKKQNCIFLEVNSRPYLAMHDVPRYGSKEDLSPYYEKLEPYRITTQNTF